MVSKASTKRVNKILQQAAENLKNKPTKNRITITVDPELDEILKDMGNQVNVSDLCNRFLWLWVNKKKRDNNKAGQGGG